MTTQEWQASARLQDLSESCPTTDQVIADKRDILAVCKALKRSEDLRERAEARVIDLVEYKQRVEVSMKACESFISDEVIRRKQADAVLRAVRVLKNTTYAPPPGTNTFWAGVDHSITEMVNYSEAIRRGEVEI